jgi:hypothetical protein
MIMKMKMEFASEEAKHFLSHTLTPHRFLFYLIFFIKGQKEQKEQKEQKRKRKRKRKIFTNYSLLITN